MVERHTNDEIGSPDSDHRIEAVCPEFCHVAAAREADVSDHRLGQTHGRPHAESGRGKTQHVARLTIRLVEGSAAIPPPPVHCRLAA